MDRRDRDEAIARLISEGLPQTAVAKRLGIAQSTVSRVAGRLGIRNGRPDTRLRVATLLDRGLTRREVAERLGVSASTVTFHVRALGGSPDPRFARRYDWTEIRRVYEGGLSPRECRERFGFSRDAWRKAVLRGDIVLRDWRIPLSSLLVRGRETGRSHLKLRLLGEDLKVNRCEECGIEEWRGRPLAMQLHHVNGDGSDNRLENLRLLCPNCHAQTDNWAGRNVRRRAQAAACSSQAV